MSFRIKLDENLARAHQAFLTAQGYDVEHVYDEQLSGASDREVWLHAQAEQRFFITLDLDFSDVRLYAPGTHSGILLLRPPTNSRESVMRILEKVCAEYHLSMFSGCLVVADERRTRVRRPAGT